MFTGVKRRNLKQDSQRRVNNCQIISIQYITNDIYSKKKSFSPSFSKIIDINKGWNNYCPPLS